PFAPERWIVFHIRIHPHGNKETNKDFTFFRVFCNDSSVQYRVKFYLTDSRHKAIKTTTYTGEHQQGFCNYVRRNVLISRIQPSDELKLTVMFSLVQGVMTRSFSTKPFSPLPLESEVAQDLEIFRHEAKLTDFCIKTHGCEFKVHKAILYARSPVFAAMLQPHTEEFQTGRVVLDDIDPVVMENIICFIYCGKCPNINEYAVDLFAAGDRFLLDGLKKMGEYVRSKLFF
ncbi:unnamed protein product, partial [Soboliphyme baturini]|uniref:BTB domain-containing protein n=1 Tax=Soboliphyme baturini TaxID=241478 RepID=A0A183IL70_9BILA